MEQLEHIEQPSYKQLVSEEAVRLGLSTDASWQEVHGALMSVIDRSPKVASITTPRLQSIRESLVEPR